MCSYINNFREIADAMESADLDGHIEGDFTEEEFIKGAKEYIRILRKEGASIPKK